MMQEDLPDNYVSGFAGDDSLLSSGDDLGPPSSDPPSDSLHSSSSPSPSAPSSRQLTPEPQTPDDVSRLKAQTDFVLDLDSRSMVAPAFREKPGIRLLYMQATLANIFGSSTVDQASKQISDGLDIIEESTGSLPVFPKPARSLATAKRLLGLDIDDYIDRRAICTACYKHYSPAEIAVLPSPSCTVQRCLGHVYSIKRDGDGLEKRVPAKIQTYSSFMKALQRFLLRPDFVQNLIFPSSFPDRRLLSEDEPMHDFHDGEAFGGLVLGLERIKLADGSIADCQMYTGTLITLKSVPYGLSLSIYIDWFSRLAASNPPEVPIMLI